MQQQTRIEKNYSDIRIRPKLPTVTTLHLMEQTVLHQELMWRTRDKATEVELTRTANLLQKKRRKRRFQRPNKRYFVGRSSHDSEHRHVLASRYVSFSESDADYCYRLDSSSKLVDHGAGLQGC